MMPPGGPVLTFSCNSTSYLVPGYRPGVPGMNIWCDREEIIGLSTRYIPGRVRLMCHACSFKSSISSRVYRTAAVFLLMLSANGAR